MYGIEERTYTPDNFFRGFFPAVPEHGTVKDGATVRKYAPVAQTEDGIEEVTAETLDKLVKAAVQGEVKKRLNSNVPSVGADSNETITKESFKKMTLAQRTALFQNDPELYKQLSR